MPGFRAHLERSLSAFSAIPERIARLGARAEAEPAPVDPRLAAAEDAAASSLDLDDLRGDPWRLPVGHFALHSGATVPALVPFGEGGHLALSRDARDPAVAGLAQTALLHVLARTDPGAVRVVGMDTGALGAAFAPFTALQQAGVLEEVATDAAGQARVLDMAERQVAEAIAGRSDDRLVLVVASWEAPTRAHRQRLDALAHSGRAHGVAIIACGLPDLQQATRIDIGESSATVHNPPGEPWTTGEEYAIPLTLPSVPSSSYLASEAARLADRAREAGTLRFSDLVPLRTGDADPADGLEVRIGRDRSGDVALRFDDLTPHWLIGGRTGGGKTVFLLDLLYGLATRYRPGDVALFLLDFKEGVSFSEFIPTGRDRTYIPHARAVGVESDREYGLAVLEALSQEMVRRSQVMKNLGVSSYAALRRHEEYPRIVCVADEFQVLLAGNDRVAQQAVAALETIARKGRSYGVHLVLASQTLSGIESLWAKKDSIFGQFPMRVALPGAKTILEPDNNAAQGLSLGQVVVNTEGGAKGADRIVRFPNADDDHMRAVRENLNRTFADARPPRIFYGYKPLHLSDALPGEKGGDRLALGRHVDVGLSIAAPALTRSPGRNLALLGSDKALGETLEAAVEGLVPERRVVAVDETGAAVLPEGVEKAASLAEAMEDVADDTVIAVWGAENHGLDRAGLTRFRELLRRGPERGVHILGWWRALRRHMDDIGGSAGREDCAVSLVGTIPGGELIGHFGQQYSHWSPRAGRALLIDRHSDDSGGRLIIPFTRPEGVAMPHQSGTAEERIF
ncbi:FtsK/SpoIIIE domain-containing protein [Salininema proteolyticum]|uniref:FtsK/SpoIIIE domain-containing protein n=1 Tax=Salininema proteolyticum TaxID=1607685 RepID=A0ABV8TT93_9ACTN